jgi:hypothetical protein
VKAFGGDRLAANYKTAAAIQGAYRDDPDYGVVARFPGVGVTVYLSSITSEMQQMPAFERAATLTPSLGFMSGPRIANPDEADSRWVARCCARPSGQATVMPPTRVMKARRFIGLVLVQPRITPGHMVADHSQIGPCRLCVQTAK